VLRDLILRKQAVLATAAVSIITISIFMRLRTGPSFVSVDHGNEPSISREAEIF
jgi:hypothetical protein